MKTNTLTLRTAKLCLYWLSLLLTIPMSVAAQPLSVALHMHPNPSPYLSDWEQRSETIVLTITNTSAQAQNVYFTGTVTGDNGVSGKTKQGFKPARPLQVPPNTTTSYTGPQLKGMFVWEEIQSTGVDVANITRSGMLPAGEYELCVTLISFQTDLVLTSVEPSGCTPSFTIALPQPPVVTTPPCEETVSSAQGQPILFSWMPMAGTPQRVQYRLRIVEIIGNRSANDALQSATTPPVFDKTISGNSYMLNPVQIVTPNRPGPIRFAWTVTAVDPANKTFFSNNGESEACSFEYGKDGPGTSTAAVTDIIRTPIWIEIGKPWRNCYGFGICKIHVELPPYDKAPPAPDAPKAPDAKEVPDSRLDPKKPKVYATLQLDSDGKALTLSLSESDIKKYQPDKLEYFTGKTSVTFEEDNPVAPKIWRDFFHKANPVIIKAGTYPLRLSGPFYIIESIRIAPLGTPPFYADLPPKDTVIADTIPCKELEAKIKAAEADLKKLKDELASLDGDGKFLDGKIKAEKASAEICNRVLKGLQVTSDSWKKSVDACAELMKTEKPLTASTKERCAKVQKIYDEALAKTEEKQKECERLAENIKALEARKAALIDLIKTGEAELGGLKEALEKCKKEAEEKKKKAEADAARAARAKSRAAAGSGSSGAGSTTGGPGTTGAPVEDSPCHPEGAEGTGKPFSTTFCTVDDISAVDIGETKELKDDIKDLKKFVNKYGKSWGKKLLSRGLSVVAAVKLTGTAHRAEDWYAHYVVKHQKNVITYICKDGKWKKSEKILDEKVVEIGWFKLMAPHGSSSQGWNGTEGLGELKDAIQAAVPSGCGDHKLILE